MVKEIAGGRYNNLLKLKTAIDAKQIIHQERPEFFNHKIKELTASEILDVTAVYLSALTRFEEEQEQKVTTYFETSGGESNQPPPKEKSEENKEECLEDRFGWNSDCGWPW